MIRSGIAPLDDVFGGMRHGAIAALTGGPGSGKSTWCLRFATAGLELGERVAMLVQGRRDAVLSHAEYLGANLGAPLRDGRLLLLRYHGAFTRRLAGALGAERALEDLQRMFGLHRPQRVIIDSISPLLDDGSGAGFAAATLAEMLERLGAATLLTHPEDVRAGYDRRLEPLVQAASLLLRLTRQKRAGVFAAEVVLQRGAAGRSTSACFAIRRGEGVPLLAGAPDGLDDGDDRSALEHGPLLLLHTTDGPSDELVAVLGRQRELVAQRATVDASPDELLLGACAVVVETDHTSLDVARAMIRARQADPGTPPLLVAVRFNLRSIDRARLLRDGADDVLSGDMGTAEVLQRVAAALRRGHLVHPPFAVQEDERLTQRVLAESEDGPLDRDRFARAVARHSLPDDAAPFTIVRLTTATMDSDELRSLAELALKTVRVASGDLVALLDDGVAVYLHGARRRDVAPFIERLRARWPEKERPVRAEAACFPNELARLRQLVEPAPVS